MNENCNEENLIKQNILVSIILPIYNVGGYLNKCLESISAQNYRNIEIIAVNDGSTDDSSKILHMYKNKEPRLTIIEQENGGLSSARNAGLDVAKGEWIAFVDSDDFVPENMIFLLLSNALKNNVKVSVGGLYRTYENNINRNIQKHVRARLIENKRDFHMLFTDYDRVDCYVWNKIYHRSIWEELRFPIGKKYEDIYVTPDYIEKAEKCVVFDMPVYYYYIRKGSITNQILDEKKTEQYFNSIKDKYDAYNKWMGLLAEKYPDLEAGLSSVVLDACILDSGKIIDFRLPYTADLWMLLISEVKKCEKYFKHFAIKYKLALILFKISPKFLGKIEKLYSQKKNN